MSNLLVENEQKDVDNKKKIDKKDLNKVFWRSHMIQGSWNYEKQMGLGYAFSMIPVLRKLYKDGSPEMAEALKRHTELVNVTPQCATFMMGLSASMEEEKLNNPNFPVETINSVKVSLMGPLSGIGDSFFWGTFKVISTGLGINLASNGSILGPVMLLITYNIPSFLVRWFGLKIGYKTGNSFLEKLASSNIMDKITFGASIVGLMVVGAMTASMINLKFALEYSNSYDTISLQSILDSILPSALPLVSTIFVYWLLRKKVSVNWIILGIIIFGVLSSYIGLFKI